MDFQREFRKRALIARVLFRVWMVYGCAALQTCATYLVFGGLLPVLRYKRAQLISCLEGLRLCCAPNVGSLSRVWRVCGCLALQTRGNFPAFVVDLLLRAHIKLGASSR